MTNGDREEWIVLSNPRTNNRCFLFLTIKYWSFMLKRLSEVPDCSAEMPDITMMSKHNNNVTCLLTSHRSIFIFPTFWYSWVREIELSQIGKTSETWICSARIYLYRTIKWIDSLVFIIVLATGNEDNNLTHKTKVLAIITYTGKFYFAYIIPTCGEKQPKVIRKVTYLLKWHQRNISHLSEFREFWKLF